MKKLKFSNNCDSPGRMPKKLNFFFDKNFVYGELTVSFKTIFEKFFYDPYHPSKPELKVCL